MELNVTQHGEIFEISEEKNLFLGIIDREGDFLDRCKETDIDEEKVRIALSNQIREESANWDWWEYPPEMLRFSFGKNEFTEVLEKLREWKLSWNLADALACRLVRIQNGEDGDRFLETDDEGWSIEEADVVGGTMRYRREISHSTSGYYTENMEVLDVNEI